jgi:hypothetical protein
MLPVFLCLVGSLLLLISDPAGLIAMRAMLALLGVMMLLTRLIASCP